MTAISTRNLTALPDANVFRELLRSMAMLDAIICPEWEYRYYSFNSQWANGEEMGSMRNGQGDDFFALFNAQGCFLKGFVHDSPSALVEVDSSTFYSGIPAEFESCVTEPAFSTEVVTFSIWRTYSEKKWNCNAVELTTGEDVDGSEYLLSPFDGNPDTYREWAEEYYERDVSLHGVTAVFEQQSLTEEIISLLNADLRISDLAEDIREINYPV